MSRSSLSRENSLEEEDQQGLQQQQQPAVSNTAQPQPSKRKQHGGSTEVSKKPTGKVMKTKQSKQKTKKHESSHQTDFDVDGKDTTGSNRAKSPSSMDSKSNISRRDSDGGSTGDKSKVRADNEDVQKNANERTPSASSSKPSIIGIVGARKLGVKWRQMIGSEATHDEEFSGKERGAAATADDSETVPPAAPRRAKGSDVIAPTVNGMRQFGVSKGIITRAIVKFNTPPSPHPLTVCFHFPGTFLTHRYVLDMVRGKVQTAEGSESNANGVGKVSTIQFIDRNTMHGTQGMDNRWLVTLTKSEYVDILLQQGLHLFNRQITLRRYDDILSAEYAEYIEYRNLQNKLYAKNEEDGEVPENSAVDADTENGNDIDGEKGDVISDDEFQTGISLTDKELIVSSALHDSSNDVTHNTDAAADGGEME